MPQDDGAMLVQYYTPTAVFGDTVWVPDEDKPHTYRALVVSDPNWSGRVRIEWDENAKSHQFGFFMRTELEVVTEEELDGVGDPD